MVFADNPEMVPENAPVPDPMFSTELDSVGEGEVPYTKPLAVTGEPPSEVTLPPPLAELFEILDIALVTTAGTVAVVKLTSFP